MSKVSETKINDDSLNEEVKLVKAIRDLVIENRKKIKLEAKKIVKLILNAIYCEFEIDDEIDINADKYIAQIVNYYNEGNDMPNVTVSLDFYFDTDSIEGLQEALEDSCENFEYDNKIKQDVWKEMLSLFKKLKMKCMCPPNNCEFYLIFDIIDFKDIS